MMPGPFKKTRPQCNYIGFLDGDMVGKTALSQKTLTRGSRGHPPSGHFCTDLWPQASQTTSNSGSNPNLISPNQASDRDQHCNPDPLLCLIGEANETSVYVDAVECTAVIGSVAQISTITQYFAKHLGLPIMQIELFLNLEVTRRGKIPYLGYVETHLEIPEIHAFKEDVLVLVLENHDYWEMILIPKGILHIKQVLDFVT